MRALDDIDLQIVVALSHDARLAVTNLAEMIGLTRQAVAERLSRLEREQVIRGYTVLVDEDALGLKTRAIIAIRMRPGCSLDDDHCIIAIAQVCPWVRECYHVSGDDCYMARVVAPDLAAINDLIVSLRETGLVEQTRTSLAISNAFEKSAIGPLNIEDIRRLVGGVVMDSGLLLKGMILGLSIAAPVGPIGLLCIRRTLAGGRTVGFVSGLGAATADALYGSIAAFGLLAISELLISLRFWLGLIGGLFLCYLGISTAWSKPPAQEARADERGGLVAAYFSSLALTLANPTTILSFVAIFGGLGIVERGPYYTAASLLVLGVFLGSAAWWRLLSSAVSLARGRITPPLMRAINVGSGAIIVIFGLVSLWQSRGH